MCCTREFDILFVRGTREARLHCRAREWSTTTRMVVGEQKLVRGRVIDTKVVPEGRKWVGRGVWLCSEVDVFTLNWRTLGHWEMEYVNVNTRPIALNAVVSTLHVLGGIESRERFESELATSRGAPER